MSLLAIGGVNQKEDILEVELCNSKYEKDERILKYEFTFLGNATASGLPSKLEKSVLIIDDIYSAMKPIE